MAPRSDHAAPGLRHAGDDAFQITVDYLKQETIAPLRGLGRFLYMGIAGSFFLAGGILLVLIGILRLLQTETGTALSGDWSWAPYAIVVVLGIAIIAVAAWRITAGPGQQKLPAVMARRAGGANGEAGPTGQTGAPPRTGPTPDGPVPDGPPSPGEHGAGQPVAHDAGQEGAP
jgi:hypothetical protein